MVRQELGRGLDSTIPGQSSCLVTSSLSSRIYISDFLPLYTFHHYVHLIFVGSSIGWFLLAIHASLSSQELLEKKSSLPRYADQGDSSPQGGIRWGLSRYKSINADPSDEIMNEATSIMGGDTKATKKVWFELEGKSSQAPPATYW